MSILFPSQATTSATASLLPNDRCRNALQSLCLEEICSAPTTPRTKERGGLGVDLGLEVVVRGPLERVWRGLRFSNLARSRCRNLPSRGPGERCEPRPTQQAARVSASGLRRGPGQ